MDTIKIARQLGHAIQQDGRYIAFMLASQLCEEDAALKEIIAAFHQKRTEITAELQKGGEKDEAQVTRLNAEMQEMYQSVMNNENMVKMNSAKKEMQEMLSFINQIVNGSSQGQNPDTIEYAESCAGDCSGCGSGCS